MVVGMIWHSPSVFGKKWMELTKVTEEQAAGTDMKAAMIKAFLNNILQVYVLALILVLVQPGTITDGIILAALLTLVIPIPLLISNTIWEHRPIGLLWVSGGYHFVSAAVATVILMSM